MAEHREQERRGEAIREIRTVIGHLRSKSERPPAEDLGESLMDGLEGLLTALSAEQLAREDADSHWANIYSQALARAEAAEARLDKVREWAEESVKSQDHKLAHIAEFILLSLLDLPAEQGGGGK